MNADRSVFLKYTAKRASVANGWKKWQGELKGLQQNHVLDKKREQETRFMTWLNLHLMDSTVSGKASEILQSMDAICNAANATIKTDEYIKEGVSRTCCSSRSTSSTCCTCCSNSGPSSTNHYNRYTNGIRRYKIC
jgi:hypothetical protein